MKSLRDIVDQKEFNCCNCNEPVLEELLPTDLLVRIQAIEHGINCPDCSRYNEELDEPASDVYAPKGAIQGRSVNTHWPDCEFRFDCPIRDLCLEAKADCSK